MSTTINKSIWFGLLATMLIVYLAFNSSGTMTMPYKGARPFGNVKTDYVKFIYRGIPCNNHNYQDALSGIAKPYGGHSNPERHRDGDNNSTFTSWTTDFMIAYKYATTSVYGSCSGVILMKKVDLQGSQFVDVNQIPGGDVYNEFEIMVKGMITGCIPIKVNPGMDKNQLINLLK